MNKTIKFCRKCCLTTDYPGIKFRHGICNYCEEFNYDKYRKNLDENKKNFKHFLKIYLRKN